MFLLLTRIHDDGILFLTKRKRGFSTMTDDERKKNLKIVWRKTHKDFKGKTNGVKSIMIWRNGTTLVPLDSLTDKEILERI